jgi:L-asparaginase/beta-aspartyl-peptidase (threonine type)
MGNNNGRLALVVHGGAGSARTADDGCERAAGCGMELLAEGKDALDAVIAAVTVLEDDERFNAGTGSELSLDGVTIEMDAAIMDTRGRLGAVAAVRAIRNPVLLARAVADTPHHLIVGAGAQLLARTLGFAAHDPATGKARRHHAELLARLQSAQAAMPGVSNEDFARFWNYEAPHALRTSRACDTVGAVARDAAGHFAVAGSPGGSTPALLGRVGDTCLVGSGFYAGPLGAIAATGVGEYIMRHLLAREVYGWIAQGMPLQQALQRGVDLFEPEVDIGLIGVTRDDTAVCANRDMAQAVVCHD